MCLILQKTDLKQKIYPVLVQKERLRFTSCNLYLLHSINIWQIFKPQNCFWNSYAWYLCRSMFQTTKVWSIIKINWSALEYSEMSIYRNLTEYSKKNCIHTSQMNSLSKYSNCKTKKIHTPCDRVVRIWLPTLEYSGM